MNIRRYIMLLVTIMTATILSASPMLKFDEEAYIAEQHAFILKEVKCLSPEEAKTFFTIYDEMRCKLRKVFDKMRQDRRKKLSGDEAYRDLIETRDNDGLMLKQIEQRYHKKMLKVLSPKKVYKALVAADKFDKMKFHEMNKNHHDK